MSTILGVDSSRLYRPFFSDTLLPALDQSYCTVDTRIFHDPITGDAYW
jgi:hypothetical protein